MKILSDFFLFFSEDTDQEDKHMNVNRPKRSKSAAQNSHSLQSATLYLKRGSPVLKAKLEDRNSSQRSMRKVKKQRNWEF